MRIALLLSLLFLAGCAAGKPVDDGHGRGRYDLSGAEEYCLNKGYGRNSYDYAACYANQPQVQAWERDGRMNGLNILRANRSPRNYGGRSYPVD